VDEIDSGSAQRSGIAVTIKIGASPTSVKAGSEDLVKAHKQEQARSFDRDRPHEVEGATLRAG